MKTKSTLLLSAFILTAAVSKSQLIVNEVSANLLQDLVEVKNVGNTSLDISTYFICSFPDYEQFNTLTIECEEIPDGGFVLEPGEIITISGHDLGATDGEVGIYTDDQFANPDYIISYMQYGSAGHEREDEAVAAGVWTAGDFMTTPNFNGGETLAYDGDGITDGDWFVSDLPSPCIENITNVGEVTAITGMTVYPNPASEKLCVEGSELGLIRIIDIKGSVVLEVSKEMNLSIIDISDLRPGLYVASLGQNALQFRID